MVFDVYVDGSFSKLHPEKTTGAMVVVYEGSPIYAQRFVITKREFVSMNNVGGELVAAGSSLMIVGELVKLITNNEDTECTIVLHHDYAGIRNFIEGKPLWIPKKEGSAYYVAMVNEFVKRFPKIKLRFNKVKAHSGNEWNEVADSLANGIVPASCRNITVEDKILA